MNIPPEITAESKYNFYLEVINEGQAIRDEQYEWIIESIPKLAQIKIVPVATLKPESAKIIRLSMKTGEETGDFVFRAKLLKNGTTIVETKPITVRVAPLPELDFQVKLGWKNRSDDSALTLLIYDDKKLVKKVEAIKLVDGKAQIIKLNDLVLHQPYRFVLTKPYYLPRQVIAILQPKLTQITFKRLLPIDLLPDGKLTWRDALNALIMPKLSINLWWPF
jgi:hypothetical protein